MAGLNRNLFLYILFIILFFICNLLFTRYILSPMGDYLVIQDNLHPSDMIHVIAGEDYRNNYAVQLYKQGYAKVIFYTGGPDTDHGTSHSQYSMQMAFDQGVPLEAMAYDETPIKSTYDEVLLLKNYIEKNKLSIQSIIVVSDPFHMRRAHWAYQRVFGNKIKILMAPVSFSQTPYQRDWWNDYNSRHYVKDEYVKLVYYVARYQLSWGPIKDWLASFDTE